MWKDYAFRLFVIDAVTKSKEYDLRLTQGPMGAMSDDEQDFFKFIVNHSSHSFSQGAQDLWALYELKESRNRFFVEFGATDGVKINNTVLLEREYGWNGILAEPNPVWHKALHENRTAIMERRCVYSVTGDVLEFLNTNSPEFGGVVDENTRGAAKRLHMKGGIIKVETVSLNDLLEHHHAPTQIDFMSIDTEGSEYEILKAFDFKKWNVRLLTVELRPVEKDQAIDRLMKENGYVRRFEKFSGGDAWYKKIA
jgi:FkbM family methyltransferase